MNCVCVRTCMHMIGGDHGVGCVCLCVCVGGSKTETQSHNLGNTFFRVGLHGQKDGWMDGWMEGWRDGGMEVERGVEVERGMERGTWRDGQGLKMKREYRF